MDLDDLARRVGQDRFAQACAHARAGSVGAGSSAGSVTAPDPDLPHELSDLVEGDLGLALALYRAMPCYANLMYLEHWVPRSTLLGELRVLLDDPDDELADPVSYWLWCGPFEGGDAESAGAWDTMSAHPTDRRLHRLLAVSGPVPWAAKQPVLEVLAGDERWHDAIWRAVRDAVTDVYGRVDAHDAQRLLDRLVEPPPEIGDADLRLRLRTRCLDP